MNLLTSMRYLVALNEHRHFARAAQACHITQPALSNALKALEDEFGERFVRIHRNCLVAREQLLELRRGDSGALAVLRDVPQPLEVSRRCVPELRRMLDAG